MRIINTTLKNKESQPRALIRKKLFSKDRVFLNTLIQGIGHFFSIIFSLITVYILTRHLGIYSYGRYTTVFAYFGIFSTIGELGIDRFLVRKIAQNIKNKKLVEEYINSCISLRMFLTLTALSLSLLVSIFLPYDKIIRIGIIIVFIHYFFFFLAMIFIDFFQAHSHFVNNTVSLVLARFISLIFVLLVVLMKSRSLLLLVFSSSITGVVTFLFMYYFFKREAQPLLVLNLKKWGYILKSSSMIAISSVLYQLFFRLDIPLLSVLIGPSAVGIYSLSHKIFENSALPIALYTTALFPVLARELKKSKTTFIHKFNKRSKNIILIGSFLALMIALFSPQIVDLLGGEKFSASVIPLRILTLALFLLCLSRFFYVILIAMEEEKKAIIISAGALLLNLLLNLLLIPIFNYLAAAAVAVITQLFVAGCSFFVVRSYLKET